MPIPRSRDTPWDIRRARMLSDLARSAQWAVTGGILFHQAVADRLGLHISDLRCLNILLEAAKRDADYLLPQFHPAVHPPFGKGHDDLILGGRAGTGLTWR